jgi:hypothetical protein
MKTPNPYVPFASELDLLTRSECEGFYPLPKTLATLHDLPPPIAYVIHNRMTYCSCCFTAHSHVEMFSLYHTASRTGAKVVRHLVPVQRVTWRLPIYSERLPSIPIDLCPLCIGTDKAQAYLETRLPPTLPEPNSKPSAEDLA